MVQAKFTSINPIIDITHLKALDYYSEENEKLRQTLLSRETQTFGKKEWWMDVKLKADVHEVALLSS